RLPPLCAASCRVRVGTRAQANYHITMKLRVLSHVLLGLLLVAVPRAFGQALPDLGDISQAALTPLQERRMGESIMREVRTDRSYYDEPEATDYLNHLEQRLSARSVDARQDFEIG